MKLTPLGANKNEVDLGLYKVLFSYQTPVAYGYNGRYFETSTKWSRTTSKHINKWLNGAGATKVSQESIDDIVNKGGVQC